MTDANVDIGRGQYTINRDVQPDPSNVSYIIEKNELLANASHKAKSASSKLPKLYGKIVTGNIGQDTADILCQTLEAKLLGPDKIIQDNVGIEILADITLNKGISYSTSGKFDSIYSEIISSYRKVFEKQHRTNTQIHDAFVKLLENGYVAPGGDEKEPVLIATSNIDPYLNNAEPYVSKKNPESHKESNNHHSLRLGEKIGHLVHHHH